MEMGLQMKSRALKKLEISALAQMIQQQHPRKILQMPVFHLRCQVQKNHHIALHLLHVGIAGMLV